MENKSNKMEKFSWVIISFVVLIIGCGFLFIDREERRLIEYENRIDSCLSVIKLQEGQMKAISHIYDVDFEKLKSEKLDSALMLLGIYRDRLHYDSLKRYWYISEHSIESEHYIEKIYRDTVKVKTPETVTAHSDTIQGKDFSNSINP